MVKNEKWKMVNEKRKMVINIEFIPLSLTLQTAKLFPLRGQKRILKN